MRPQRGDGSRRLLFADATAAAKWRSLIPSPYTNVPFTCLPAAVARPFQRTAHLPHRPSQRSFQMATMNMPCLLYTSDAADERSSVDLGGRRIIKKKNNEH